MTDHGFCNAFVARVRQDWRAEQRENFDYYRFPNGNVGASKWRDFARKFGGERVRSLWRVGCTIARSRELQWMHDRLDDDVSRKLMVDVLNRPGFPGGSFP